MPEEDSWGWQLSLWMRQLQETMERWSRQIPQPPAQDWDWPRYEGWQPYGLALLGIGIAVVVAVVVRRVVARGWNPLHTLAKIRLHRPENTVQDWLRLARHHQQQGDFATACRELYQALLVYLEQRRGLPQQPSRTNGEVLTVVRHLPEREAVEQVVETHTRVVFGRFQPTAETVEQVWQAMESVQTDAELPSGTEAP
ncbi:MAG: hypothetical protein OHK0012_06230 [Synechococcales cyanobacterium]